METPLEWGVWRMCQSCHMWALAVLLLGAECLLNKVGRAHALPFVPSRPFVDTQVCTGVCDPPQHLTLLHLIVWIWISQWPPQPCERLLPSRCAVCEPLHLEFSVAQTYWQRGAAFPSQSHLPSPPLRRACSLPRPPGQWLWVEGIIPRPPTCL